MIFQRWFFPPPGPARRWRNSKTISGRASICDSFISELEAEDDLTGIEGMFVSGFKEYTRLSEQSAAAIRNPSCRACSAQCASP